MPGVDLSTMTTEVRRRGGFETNSQANAFATDAEIWLLLNSGLNEFYDELIAAKGAAYFRATPQQITTVANVSSYALLTDFYKLISVDITWGQNIVRSCRPFEEAERNRFKWVAGWNYDSDVYYQIQGPTQDVTSPPGAHLIVFQPVPTGATAVTVNYIPSRPQLTNGQHQVDSVNGWTDFAIWYAIASLKEKDEADSSPALAQMERVRARVRALADNIDFAEPARVQRVRRRGWREIG